MPRPPDDHAPPPGVPPSRCRRRGRRGVTVAVALVMVVGGLACSDPQDGAGGDGEADLDLGIEPAPAGPSWAPDPWSEGDLRGVAVVEGDRYVVRTEHGAVDFLPGVNLGSTTPGHQPGEVSMTEADVRRWLRMMGEIGFRSVRIYTILPPHFYSELKAYNESHEDAPIYLMQGVYLPDESYIAKGDLFDPTVTNTFTAELRDAAAAVHGDLSRGRTPGRASGTWTADVSPWLVGWIVGSELDSTATAASDARNAAQPLFAGRYFTNTPDATPTTRWLAARMDEMATADAERGHAAPIAFANWPTLDPLTHPEEPIYTEELAGVDANTIQATDAWPAGTFATYHAYPYYPDFLRYEPGLQVERRGQADPYAGYLSALQRHHAGMPVMITEFGVPASLGTGHLGPLGRDQGDHSEQEAMDIDADLLLMIHDLELAGAFLFAWTDEWFKLTWNTSPREIPADRRHLWHDVLTNEQFFGMLAADATGGDDATLRTIAEQPSVTVAAATDESWVHLVLEFTEEPPAPVTLAFDVVGGGAERLPGSTVASGTADYAVVVDPVVDKAQAWVRAELDPVQFDGLDPPDPRPPPVDGWVPQQMTLNRARVIPSTGQQEPAEFFDVGALRQGEMTPGEYGYDSRNTWRLDGRTLTLRIPWGLLGIADPSSRQALVPSAEPQVPTATPIEQIGLAVDLGDRQVATGAITWQPWDVPDFDERLKDGAQDYVDALYDVTPR